MNSKDNVKDKLLEEEIIEIYQKITEGKEISFIQDNNLFRTSFGCDFHDDFLDLTNFVSGITSINSLLGWGVNFQEELTSPEAIPNFYNKLLNHVEITEEQRSEAQIIFGKIKIDWEEYQAKLNLHLNGLQNVFPKKEIDKIREEQEREDDNSSKDYLNWLIGEIPDRVFSYFITTLYAIIDVYTVALLQHIVFWLPTEMVYDFWDGFRIRDPKSNIKHFLDFLRDDKDRKLKMIVEDIKEKIEWEQDLGALDDFIKLRHNFAHKNPFLEIHEMMEMGKYKKYKRKAEEERRKFEQDKEKSNIKLDIVISVMDSFAEMFPYMVFIRELGINCYRILCVVDHVIADHFNCRALKFEEFLISLKDQMKDENDANIIQDYINSHKSE